MGKPLDDIKHATLTILQDVPNGVQKVMDNAAKTTGKKMWRGLLQVACSGFGKGLLVTAAVVIAAAAISSGFGAMAAAWPFEHGLALGAASAAKALIFSGPGLLILGVGGTLGAVMDVRGKQNQISAEVAQAEATMFEIMRKQQAEKAPAPEPVNTKIIKDDNIPKPEFAARELERRKSAQTSLGK